MKVQRGRLNDEKGDNDNFELKGILQNILLILLLPMALAMK